MGVGRLCRGDGGNPRKCTLKWLILCKFPLEGWEPPCSKRLRRCLTAVLEAFPAGTKPWEGDTVPDPPSEFCRDAAPLMRKA